MKLAKLLPILLVIGAGCNKHKTQPFPTDWPTATYPNGHHLIQGADTPRPEDALEAELFTQFQQWRQTQGLPGQTRYLSLDGLGRGHAEHMMEHAFYGHVNPEGLAPTDRADIIAPHTPFLLWENLWVFSPGQPVSDVLNAFINSPDHYQALVAPATMVGIGMWRGTDSTNGLEQIWIVMEFVQLY